MNICNQMLIFVNEKRLTDDEIELASAIVQTMLDRKIVGNIVPQYQTSVYQNITGMPKSKIHHIFRCLTEKKLLKRNGGKIYLNYEFYFDNTKNNLAEYRELYENLNPSIKIEKTKEEKEIYAD